MTAQLAETAVPALDMAPVEAIRARFPAHLLCIPAPFPFHKSLLHRKPQSTAFFGVRGSQYGTCSYSVHIYRALSGITGSQYATSA